MRKKLFITVDKMYNKGGCKEEYVVVLRRLFHLERQRVGNRQEDMLIVGVVQSVFKALKVDPFFIVGRVFIRKVLLSCNVMWQAVIVDIGCTGRVSMRFGGSGPK